MRCYTVVVSTYWPQLTLLHLFRHEDMLLFRPNTYNLRPAGYSAARMVLFMILQ